MDQIKCKAKHTKYQPDGDDWKCPKCGADGNNFYIEEKCFDSDDDCELVHNQDYVICEYCGYGGFGGKVTALMAKKKGIRLEKCTCCNGRGYIEIKDGENAKTNNSQGQ